MKRDDLDWSVIKLHSIIFALVLLLSAGLIFGSWTFKEDMLHEYKRNKARFTSISQKYLAVDEDERIIRQYYPEFIALYKKGIVGREHRLNWIEILRASSERIKLPGLTYGVSPQEKYDPGFNINLGKFAEYLDHDIWSHHFMGNTWRNSKNSIRLHFWGLQNLCRW